jgi:upstream activation factor subunit UAF30
MVLAKPTDDEIKTKIQEVLPRIDIDSMGMKAFIKLLSKEMGDVDLKPRKEFIKQALTEAINSETNEHEEESSEEHDDEEDAAPAIKKKKGGGLSQSKEISDKLAAFLGKGKMMARTDVVKCLWAYIREHDLQNPSNKREIILDDAMRDVFGCESFTMFTMNKYVGAHIHPFKPVDLTSSSKTASRRRSTTTTTTKKRKGKTAGNAKKKRKTGSQPPYRLSPELQDIVGTDILPRPQVVSKIWTYIKANNLQNENDKREIICDEKLLKIIKKPKISMFQMNACITEHLIEKLDKSAYHHEGSDDEEEDEQEGEVDNGSDSE